MSPAMRRILGEYLERLRAFQPNARWYLVSVAATGLSMGVFRLLFNFYALSVGFPLKSLGLFVAATNLTALLLMLPLGYVSDLIGSKAALLGRTVALGAGLFATVIAPGGGTFLLGNALIGVAQAFARVVRAPFLMENSRPRERAYLFSFASGIRMGAFFVGNTVGGLLPSWIAAARGVTATSGPAYAGALGVTAVITWLGVIPVLFIRSPQRRPKAQRGHGFTPLATVTRHPKTFFRLLLPATLIAFGAGLFVPFLNVFYRLTYHLPDPVIGQLFAWGSLAMGVGLIIAPPIADRLGKIQLVALTQGLSIPFMALLGFAPWFPLSAAAYLVRLTLMNMSNPLYDAFVMENTPTEARSVMAALQGAIWSLGRLVSPPISSWWQERWGFGPVFLAAMGLYAMAVLFYGLFFLRGDRHPLGSGPVPEIRPHRTSGTGTGPQGEVPSPGDPPAP